MKIVLCFILIFWVQQHGCYRLPNLPGRDHNPVRRMINTSSDVIQHTDRQVALLNTIRKVHDNHAAFEVGYLTHIIQEKYRRMVDRFNISLTQKRDFYLMEHVLLLEEIENSYWEIQHISNMLHEVERKYNIQPKADVEYVEVTTASGEHYMTMTDADKKWTRTKRRKLRKPKPGKWLNLDASPPRPQDQNKWWPIDYGWEIDYYW